MYKNIICYHSTNRYSCEYSIYLMYIRSPWRVMLRQNKYMGWCLILGLHTVRNMQMFDISDHQYV